MNNQDYRHLPRIANSDLSDLQQYLFPKKNGAIKAKPETLQFGTIFHQMVLEPYTLPDWSLFPDDERPITRLTLNRMIEALFAGTDGKALMANLRSSQTEVVALWTDKETGLECKGKIDMKRAAVSGRYYVFGDLKTTACTTLEKFEKSCIEYGYDRQAAFYLDSDPFAEYFEIIGVQKADPFNVYRLAFHRHDNFIAGGRRLNRRLLRSAAEELKKPDGWRPRSWGRKETIQV